MSVPSLPRPEIPAAFLALEHADATATRLRVGEVHGSAAGLFVAALATTLRSRLLVVVPRPGDSRDFELDAAVLAPGVTLQRLPEIEPFASGQRE